MKNLTLVLVLGVTLVFIGTGVSLWHSSNQPESAKVVADFLNALEKKQYDEMEEFVANEPSSYGKALSLALKDISESLGQNSNQSIAKEPPINKPLGANESVKSSYNFTNKEKVTQLLRYIDDSRKFDKIVSTKELENEARVIISMKKDGLRETLHSFLLYKVSGEWKIFLISSYTEDSDLDKYWAEDRNNFGK